MFRCYEIKGITPEMFEMWKNELREDLFIWTDSRERVHVQVVLNIFEALRMRYQIRRNNKKQSDYKLRLVRVQ